MLPVSWMCLLLNFWFPTWRYSRYSSRFCSYRYSTCSKLRGIDYLIEALHQSNQLSTHRVNSFQVDSGMVQQQLDRLSMSRNCRHHQCRAAILQKKRNTQKMWIQHFGFCGLTLSGRTPLTLPENCKTIVCEKPYKHEWNVKYKKFNLNTIKYNKNASFLFVRCQRHFRAYGSERHQAFEVLFVLIQRRSY